MFFTFFSIISEKEVNNFFFQIRYGTVFFSKMFFEKLNYFFSKKAKLVTLCHHLGKARVKQRKQSVHSTRDVLCLGQIFTFTILERGRGTIFAMAEKVTSISM